MFNFFKSKKKPIPNGPAEPKHWLMVGSEDYLNVLVTIVSIYTRYLPQEKIEGHILAIDHKTNKPQKFVIKDYHIKHTRRRSSKIEDLIIGETYQMAGRIEKRRITVHDHGSRAQKTHEIRFLGFKKSSAAPKKNLDVGNFGDYGLYYLDKN